MANNENEFENEPLGENFDQDVDFGEFESDQKRASIGDVWKSSPAVKIGMIGAAILVVVAVVSLFGGEKINAPNSKVSGGAQELKEAPGTSEVTPVMKEALEEHNQQRLEEALKQGASSIPTPIEPPKVLLGVPENETSGEDPLVRWKRMQEERVRLQREQEQYATQAQTDPKKDERIAGLRDAMVTQFQDIMSKRSVPQLNNIKVTDTTKQEGEEGVMGTGLPGDITLASANGQQGATQMAPLEPVNVLFPAGQIAYAQLLLEANSDIPGPVVAMLVSGPFNGSRVLGTFKREEEYLTLQFTTLVSKEGYSIPISATAVDPDTTLTAMATDVDHRYWRRVILPAAAQFVESFGKAVADSGTTNVTVNSATGESTTTQTNDIDTKQELLKATSEATDKVGELLDEQADVEILVRVKAGTPFGLLFTAPVTDKQLKDAKFGGSAQQQQAPTQQAPLTPMQMLQQGLGNQVLLQQGATPGSTTLSVSPYPGSEGTVPTVTYTNGLQ